MFKFLKRKTSFPKFKLFKKFSKFKSKNQNGSKYYKGNADTSKIVFEERDDEFEVGDPVIADAEGSPRQDSQPSSSSSDVDEVKKSPAQSSHSSTVGVPKPGSSPISTHGDGDDADENDSLPGVTEENSNKPPKMSRSSSVRNSFKKLRRKSLNHIDNLRESIRRKSSKSTKAANLIADSSSTESLAGEPAKPSAAEPVKRSVGASITVDAEPIKRPVGASVTLGASKVVTPSETASTETEQETVVELEGSPKPFRRQLSNKMRSSFKKGGKFLKHSMDGFSAVATANGLAYPNIATTRLL